MVTGDKVEQKVWRVLLVTKSAIKQLLTWESLVNTGLDQTVCMHITMVSYWFILLYMIIVSIVSQLLINWFHTYILNLHETVLNPTLLQGIDTKSFNSSRLLNKELISFSFRLRHLFTSDLLFSHSLLQSVWSIV